MKVTYLLPIIFSIRSQTAYLLFYRKKSQDGNNQRKRKNKDIPEAAWSKEAKRLLDASFKVAPLDKKANKDNGTTGSDYLEQKCIEVHDDKKKRSDNNTDFKCEHETKGTISAEKPTVEMCSDTFRNKERVGNRKEKKKKKNTPKSYKAITTLLELLESLDVNKDTLFFFFFTLSCVIVIL